MGEEELERDLDWDCGLGHTTYLQLGLDSELHRQTVWVRWPARATTERQNREAVFMGYRGRNRCRGVLLAGNTSRRRSILDDALRRRRVLLAGLHRPAILVVPAGPVLCVQGLRREADDYLESSW